MLSPWFCIFRLFLICTFSWFGCFLSLLVVDVLASCTFYPALLFILILFACLVIWITLACKYYSHNIYTINWVLEFLCCYKGIPV